MGSFVLLAFSKNTTFSTIILLFLLLNFFGDFRSEAQILPDDEVQTLRQISTKLSIKQWDVNPNSCITGQGLNVPKVSDSISNVTCDCSFNTSTICHVTNIQLKSFNLFGALPEEFANLTYLRELELARNYLHGSIPIRWTSLPLTFLGLLGNLVNGSIPREIGNMATLEELILQDNNFGGELPQELGNLSRLRRILLSGNNFTGVLPKTLGDLKNLTDFRIDGSGISGKIPDFIGNWTKLLRLDMQGTSMEGPIPSTMSALTNLIELRISDLNASNMAFPNFQDLTNLTDLILRNCSINGSIPPYIGQRMSNINRLDLSFNRLTGAIPENFAQLSNLQFCYLTNNSLAGQVSSWLRNTKYNFDISYNNFTGPAQSSCQLKNLNKIYSYSSQADNSISWCLKRDLPCQKKPNYYNLFVNCGGSRLSFEGKNYEQDLDGMGPSSFISSDKWACSSTGDFLGNDKANYIAQANTNIANHNLYSTARLAPFSLKYYGICLRPGSYTVKLHFAEIMLTADQINNTRGRRIFDVSIQGDRLLKNFNIAEEAGGIGKSIIKEFNVIVTGSTLEIHLYWSGKGTVSLPVIGVYGPLISAISVTPNFDPSTGLSVGAIVNIVIASCVGVLLILIFLWKKGYLGGKDLEDKELKGLELQTGYFTLR